MNAHVLLNLLNALEKRIKCIYICIIKICKKESFIKQTTGQLIQDAYLISMLMYHMLLNKTQTQHEVIFITGFLVQRQGDQ